MSELLSQSYLLKMNSRDVLPANAQIPSNSTSVYARRYEVNKPSINGSTFQPNSEIIFRLNGGGATGVVPSTMCLHFDIQTDATNGTCGLDQHPALAVVQRFRSFVSGGKAVDDVNYCNNFAHAMVQLDGNKNWTKTSGSNLLGSWKYNPQYMNIDQSAEGAYNAAGALVNAVPIEAENAVLSRIATACENHDGGISVSVPLALLGCSLANQNTILPLQALGMVEFVFTLASVEKAIACLVGDNTTTAMTYVVSNPTLRCSMVEFNADYNRLFLQLVQGEVGFRMPLNCVNIQQQTTALAAAASQKDFVFSGAYRAVQDLVMWKTHPDVDDRLPVGVAGGPNCSAQFSLSTQRNGNQQSFRVNISGRNYPDYDAITTLDEMWWYNSNGLSALADYQSSVGCSDMSKFCATASIGAVGAPWNTAAIAYPRATPLRGNYLMLLSFKSAREAHNVSIQGADLSIAGSVIRVSVEDNDGTAGAVAGSGSANEALYCAFRHQRLLSLASGELNVEF